MNRPWLLFRMAMTRKRCVSLLACSLLSLLPACSAGGGGVSIETSSDGATADSSGGAQPSYGLRLEGFDYPYPVRTFDVPFAGETYEMAYMDVKPRGEALGTVVLLHGKNFSGAYWGETARDLSDAGYRVVMPDQLGFGKSDKPVAYQYSFDGLATNTRDLLREIGVEHATVLGHSMGGMLATRFALMYPDFTDRLVLLNPIGLEDWREKGVAYRGLENWYERNLALTGQKIKSYQLKSYYDNQWKPAYQPWVDMLTGLCTGPGAETYAAVQAQTYDMIYTQPVVHEFGDIRVPTLLIIGQRDRTALDRDLAPEDIRPTLGDYPTLGRAARDAIPDAELVEIEGIGHLPHIESYDRFIGALRAVLPQD